MASEWITIAKISGVSSNPLRTMFKVWKTQEPDYDRNKRNEKLEAETQGLFERIRAHALKPPVLHYQEYGDMWSFRFALLDEAFPKRDPPIVVTSHGITAACYEMQNHHTLAKHLKKKLKSKIQYAETRYFLESIFRACESWTSHKKIDKQAVILALFKVIDESIDDAEVVASMKKIPKWIEDSK